MRKTHLIPIVIMTAILFAGCNDTVTYAEKKELETQEIMDFISARDIQVVVLDEFLKDTITDNPETGPDKSKNEFVLFPESGVYVQIVRRGTGTALKDGDTKLYNYRFLEYNVATNDTVDMSLDLNDPDLLKCVRSGDNYSATLISGRMQRYGQSVPTGWLVAMPFIKPGYLNGESAAKVKIIVPHDKGTSTAMNSVTPFYYELIITSQKYGND